VECDWFLVVFNVTAKPASVACWPPDIRWWRPAVCSWFCIHFTARSSRSTSRSTSYLRYLMLLCLNWTLHSLWLCGGVVVWVSDLRSVGCSFDSRDATELAKICAELRMRIWKWTANAWSCIKCTSVAKEYWTASHD